MKPASHKLLPCSIIVTFKRSCLIRLGIKVSLEMCVPICEHTSGIRTGAGVRNSVYVANDQDEAAIDWVAKNRFGAISGCLLRD